MTNRLQLVMDFFTRAREFRQAYNDLPRRYPPDWPRYFMLCHAIELALKAYLALHGVSVRKLQSRKFGHDLEKLLSKAMERGLNIRTPRPRRDRAPEGGAHEALAPLSEAGRSSGFHHRAI